MSPEEEERVSVREFERVHASLRAETKERFTEIREDFAEMKRENADDHKSVVAEIKDLKTTLGKVVTWPQLATLLVSLCALGGLVVSVLK